MKQEKAGHHPSHADADGGVLSKVEFENERVRVIRFRFGPHAKVPLHEAPDLVSISMTDGQLRLTFPDGRTQDLRYRAGDVDWLPAQSHAGENMANAPFEFLAVQLKR